MSEYPNTDPGNPQGQDQHTNFEGVPGYEANATGQGTVYGSAAPGTQSGANQQAPPPIPPGEDNFHPPGGTYPNRFEAQPPPAYPLPPPAYRGDPAAAAVSPQPEKKGRRVGTITLAVCLILVGVVLVLRIILPDFNYILIAQLSPLILVLLGAEILIANIRHKDEKLRYDGLSIFICIVVIGASLILATLPAALESQINSGFTSRRLAAEMEDKTSAYMQDKWDGMYTVDWYMELAGTSYNKDMDISDITPDQYVQMRVHFDEEFTDAAAFAAACYDVVSRAGEEVPHLDYASFYSQKDNSDGFQGDKIYTLVIENRYNFNTTAASLAEHVETQYWLPEQGFYVSQWEYEDRQKNPENYADPDVADEPMEDPEEVDDIDDFDEFDTTDVQGLSAGGKSAFFSYPEGVCTTANAL